MIWNPEFESLPRKQLENLQAERLRRMLDRMYERVPFYRERLRDAGFKPGQFGGLMDLQELPFTTKQDLRDNYPFGLFAVDQDDVVRIHASSGTTGKMTVVGYTRNDVAIWAELMARTLSSAGATAKDVIQVAYGYGLFTGGLGAHYGAERIGATVVPISGGNTRRQITIMRDFGTTILACTPSYALYIAEATAEAGFNPRDFKLKAGVFGAEPWSENIRKEIESKLGLMAIDIYGLSEIIGPGVASECEVQNGLHVNEDHFIVEVIDPATGRRLPYGEKGELVFTTITKEAFPLLRYRTRDIAILYHEPCPCGRTFTRMSRVLGRTDDMLIVRGVNVFPSQIEGVLLSISGTEPHYQIIVDRERNLDDLEVWVEVSEGVFSDEVKRLEELGRKVRAEIESVLGISVRVKLVEPKTIARSEGKAKRVIDRRDVYGAE